MPDIPQSPATTDFANNFLTVNGEEIIGFGNDGGVVFEAASPKAEMAMGIDGKVQISRRPSSRPRIAVITLKGTSLGYGRLARQADAQAAEPKILARPFSWFNASTGTTVTSTHAVFLDEPIEPGEAADPEVTIRIGLPNAVVLRATTNVVA